MKFYRVTCVNANLISGLNALNAKVNDLEKINLLKKDNTDDIVSAILIKLDDIYKNKFKINDDLLHSLTNKVRELELAPKSKLESSSVISKSTGVTITSSISTPSSQAKELYFNSQKALKAISNSDSNISVFPPTSSNESVLKSSFRSINFPEKPTPFKYKINNNLNNNSNKMKDDVMDESVISQGLTPVEVESIRKLIHKKPPSCSICKKEGHLSNGCTTFPQCFFCDETGHTYFKCPQRKDFLSKKCQHPIERDINGNVLKRCEGDHPLFACTTFQKEARIICQGCHGGGHMLGDCSKTENIPKEVMNRFYAYISKTVPKRKSSAPPAKRRVFSVKKRKFKKK